MRGAPDPDHFARARAHGTIPATRNTDDVEVPHRRQQDHPGLFAICRDNDPRDISHAEVARAIASIVAAEVPLAGTFHTLKRWRY